MLARRQEHINVSFSIEQTVMSQGSTCLNYGQIRLPRIAWVGITIFISEDNGNKSGHVLMNKMNQDGCVLLKIQGYFPWIFHAIT